MDTEMLSAPFDTSIINSSVGRYWRVSVVELTGSTQNDLVSLVRAGSASVGDVLVADFQSAGRGRLKRSFEAPPGSALLFSIFIKPKRNSENWGCIPLIAGTSVAQVLANFNAKLKWPNDVLINEKKVAGLIAEVVESGVVIGIGMNVGMRLDQLPVPSATSLLIEGAQNVTRTDILINFLNCFEEKFAAWDRGSDEFFAEYVDLSATIGRNVRVEYPDGKNIHDVAVSISNIGELVLASGAHVQAGDIIHLR